MRLQKWFRWFLGHRTSLQILIQIMKKVIRDEAIFACRTRHIFVDTHLNYKKKGMKDKVIVAWKCQEDKFSL